MFPNNISATKGKHWEMHFFYSLLIFNRYLTQTKARPPSFVLFSNSKEIDQTYLRYLSSCLREEFNLDGVPIRIFVRTSENPYSVLIITNYDFII